LNIFESELKKGRFVVGECPKCQKITWPPNDFCNKCFGKLDWRLIKEPGILVEWSSKEGRRFCIAEFEGTIRIMGTIPTDSEPKPGQKLRIVSCGFDDSPKLAFEPAKSAL
jgi:hypothetical protein